jgi:hypothetical protein
VTDWCRSTTPLEALELLKQVVAVESRMLEDDHPDLLASLSALENVLDSWMPLDLCVLVGLQKLCEAQFITITVASRMTMASSLLTSTANGCASSQVINSGSSITTRRGGV